MDGCRVGDPGAIPLKLDSVCPGVKWYSTLAAEPSARQRTMARTPFLTLDSKGRSTLPKKDRTALGVVPNDQLWFYHPDIQARVAQAERDFADGRSTRTRTPEEAQALLDSLKQHPGR
jgi:bifunctional DNA-binding transcriptional regulator/antitoxin component of YhaV-PrlF toxin-antitoxin module